MNRTRYPSIVHSRESPTARRVAEFGGVGDSPFNVSDLVGNVWQWSTQFVDPHIRSTLLLGGSNYRPLKVLDDDGHPVLWYPFPNGVTGFLVDEPNLRYMAQWVNGGDSYDRLGTAGFRCVYPAEI